MWGGIWNARYVLPSQLIDFKKENLFYFPATSENSMWKVRQSGRLSQEVVRYFAKNIVQPEQLL